MGTNKRSDPLIGTRLGDYIIQKLIGRGGMARVYQGYDENLGRNAAVKVLTTSPEDSEDERIIERFKLEARAIASFEHPNIILIYQYGEADQMFFIAMKLVEGKTLTHELRQLRRSGEMMTPDRILGITNDMCNALDYAHARDIIHRDMKPSNILFDANANDRAILTDFGLALELGGDNTLGTAFGTPRYISPEQAVSSQKAVPQSDIYSLAVVVYEMLTGQVPFQDESPMSIALYHITSEPPPPRSINPAVPVPVEAVILKALAKDPNDRYPTAGAFYNALEDAYYEAAIDLPTPATKPFDNYPVVDEVAVNRTTGQAAPADQALSAKPADEPAPKKRPVTPAKDKPAQPAAPAKQAKKRRRRVGCIPAILMLVIVVSSLVGFWWFNGQSVLLPQSWTNTAWGVVFDVRDAILERLNDDPADITITPTTEATDEATIAMTATPGPSPTATPTTEPEEPTAGPSPTREPATTISTPEPSD